MFKILFHRFIKDKYLKEKTKEDIILLKKFNRSSSIADYNIILKIDPSNLLANKNKKVIQRKFYHELKNMNT